MIYSEPDAIETRVFSDFFLEDGRELQFMPDCIEATCPLAGDNFVDYPVPFECKIDGINPIVKNHEFGDTIRMKIGFFNPANPTQFIEVKQFGINGVALDDSVQHQGWIQARYSATLKKEIEVGGGTMVQLYVRAIYKAKSNTVAKKLLLNFRLHQIIGEAA